MGDQPSFARAQSGASLDNLLPSFVLQLHLNEEAPDFMLYASSGHESLLLGEAMDMVFIPCTAILTFLSVIWCFSRQQLMTHH